MTPCVLCPVDFSAHARHALQHASAVATRNRAPLVALFVEDALLFSAEWGGDVARGRTVLQERLERFAARALPSRGRRRAPCTCEVAVGNAAREIQAAARRLGCSLIVMGSHGLTGATRLFLGSTTERVLRNAPVPVLVIPPARPKAKGLVGLLPAGLRPRRKRA